MTINNVNDWDIKGRCSNRIIESYHKLKRKRESNNCKTAEYRNCDLCKRKKGRQKCEYIFQTGGFHKKLGKSNMEIFRIMEIGWVC